MSDPVRSEVEAALDHANNLLGTHLRRDRIQPALDAARAWLAEGDATPEAGSLSTPTEPTEEMVEAAKRSPVAASNERQEKASPTQQSENASRSGLL